MEKIIAPSPSQHGSKNQTWLEWFSTLPVFLLLTLTLIIGTGEMIHGQLLRMGEVLFGDPKSGIQYSFLRADPVMPSCNANPNIDAEVQQQMNAKADPNDPFASLFTETKDPNQIRGSLLQARDLCVEKHTFYNVAKAHITPALKVYRLFETAFFAIFRFGTENRSLLLVILLGVAGVTTTLGMHHIALRPPETKADFTIYNIAMTMASSLLVYSSIKYWFSQKASGLELDIVGELINIIWIGLFVVLTVISIRGLLKTPKHAKEGGSYLRGLLCVPLYAVMAINAGVAFIFFMGYPTGLQIYLGQLMDLSAQYLQVALYIWAGVLLKRTSLMDKFLDIARPFNFSPESLTIFIMLGAAVCTAYTGASGIFVVAAGGLIYKEVTAAGARPQYALAAAAMSGSLGVVLNPCLLIVIIVALNKQVTSDELFHYGFMVFCISTTVFYLTSLMLAKDKFKLKNPIGALPEVSKKLIAALPYLLITVVVIFFYKYALNTKFDEFTAPMIIPLIMLAIVFYDNYGGKKSGTVSDTPALDLVVPHKEPVGFMAAVRAATSETVGHIGALVLLMGLSISVGGLIDRLELFAHVPVFTNLWASLTIFMIVLMIVGMIMDPYGALILVSAVIAPVAYQNGIHPAHFWMIALTAFEFGYLCPPVALNQLLARQSVGEAEIARVDESVKNLSFYWKYERWLLPLFVLGLCMLIVSYAPYFFRMFNWYNV